MKNFEDVRKIEQDTRVVQQIISKVLEGNKNGVTVNIVTIGVIQIGADDKRTVKMPSVDAPLQLSHESKEPPRHRHAYTKEEVQRAFTEAGGVKRIAADRLGIASSHMCHLTKKFGIEKED